MEPNRKSSLHLSLFASDLPIDANSPLLGSAAAVVMTSSIPHPEEPNLYMIPSSLSAVYKPLPSSLQLSIDVVAAFVAASTLMGRPDNLLQLRSLQLSSISTLYWWTASVIRKIQLTKFIVAACKALALYVATTCALQDFLPRCRPSRVSTQELATNYNLPSPFSRYAQVAAAHHRRVHWLEYETTTSSLTSDFDVVYVNHGFGASSLSWLPAMPVLGVEFGSAVLGHDAPGFGFTDRPVSDLRYYTVQNSAAIGASLVQEHLSRRNGNRATLLLGHSMGCLTTLTMALILDPTIKQRIILVAPAFGLRPEGKKQVELSQRATKSRLAKLRLLGRPVVHLLSGFACYNLRRLVGYPNFWRNGLSFVWGDSARLKDSDVLRFQWPSIGQGWERGLLQYARAQVFGRDEQELLRAVLEMPNVHSVDVILGSKDQVVQGKRVRNFFHDFPEVNIVEMKGLGHDPFEEDPHSFVEIVRSLLRC